MKNLNSWLTANTVAYEDAAIILRCFRKGNGTPILILPPQAGHTSVIADYAEGKSIVQCALDNTDLPVYCIDWKSCTKERADESYEDLLGQVNTAIHATENGKKAHLVGLCQGGTLATILTAISPELVASLTIAGAPIDLTEPSVLNPAIRQPMFLYEMTVGLQGGLMTGDTMLSCWTSFEPERHAVDRLNVDNDPRSSRYNAWFYENVQDIAGGWYLYLIENLFKGNKLVRKEMKLFGNVVDLSRITCPLNLVTGTRDDISPPSHTLNLANHVRSAKVHEYQGVAGHISVFMGSKMLAGAWTKLFQDIN